jgi:hypothetical protein
MWQYNGSAVREGRTWMGVVDGAVTQMSPQWHLWSSDEKEAAGLVEIIPEAAPDDRFYRWTQNPDGTINKTARDLVDVKLSFKGQVKLQQGSLLTPTDWVIIRKADTGTAVPSDIQTWRDEIRAKATEMEEAIDSAVDADALVALLLVWDSDGNKTGVLYDWPEDPTLKKVQHD